MGEGGLDKGSILRSLVCPCKQTVLPEATELLESFFPGLSFCDSH